MPEKIFEIVSKEDDSNDLFGVIPALTELLEISNDIEVAYLCNQEAVQIATIPNEGCHFCGYRNIQMLLLSLDPESRLKISSKKLAIPEIQDMIEKAWDADINAHGRVQTGGIKGTRKHIGTSEVSRSISLISSSSELTNPTGRSNPPPPLNSLYRVCLPGTRSLVSASRLCGGVLRSLYILNREQDQTDESFANLSSTPTPFINDRWLRTNQVRAAKIARL